MKGSSSARFRLAASLLQTSKCKTLYRQLAVCMHDYRRHAFVRCLAEIFAQRPIRSFEAPTFILAPLRRLIVFSALHTLFDVPCIGSQPFD